MFGDSCSTHRNRYMAFGRQSLCRILTVGLWTRKRKQKVLPPELMSYSYLTQRENFKLVWLH